MLALPAPVLAQVDWSILNGTKGPDTCPPGQSERSPNVLLVGIPLTSTSVAVTLGNVNPVFFQGISSSASNVYVSVLEDGKIRVGPSSNNYQVGKKNTAIASRNISIDGLKKGVRYTVVLHVGSNPTIIANQAARACFKTEPDLEIPLGSGRGGDGPGDSWSSGCYAFSKDPNQIRACFCGARNSSGSWARTDAEDGYEYMMDAAWRQNVGCTTN